jgi:hypothetical protein
LGHAAGTARPSPGVCPRIDTQCFDVADASRRRLTRASDDGVQRIFTGSTAAIVSPSRADGGHVLAAVDGEVHFVPEQRVFDLLHEETLAANFRQRARPAGGRRMS